YFLDVLAQSVCSWLHLQSIFFFFSIRRRHTRSYGDWSSDVCSSDLLQCLRCVHFAESLAEVDAPKALKLAADAKIPQLLPWMARDRKSVVQGTSVHVRTQRAHQQGGTVAEDSRRKSRMLAVRACRSK